MATVLSSADSSSSSFVNITDDNFEDACSICLEPFTSLDPSTVTKCNHDYHLQCILEWFQRSNKCPVCSQHLVLKDPASQELLSGLENDKNLKLKNNFHPVDQHNEVNNDAAQVDVSDFEERATAQYVAVINKARIISRSIKQSTPAFRSSQYAAVMNRAHVNSRTRKQSTPDFGPSQIPPSVPSESIDSDNPGTSSSPKSLKSNIITASSKCKESILKNTRGLKEKFAVRNDSVKELSRGIQLEMTAGLIQSNLWNEAILAAF
ncbi:hypothetical protein DH2020_043599 [Rehmannia glutinosa]|uniref:RING-type E3 ubiquitin transferase n=1 Tax=Rehmannia glutinosa TaxID=99300 RepID=A0ABR0UJ71_REHGL